MARPGTSGNRLNERGVVAAAARGRMAGARRAAGGALLAAMLTIVAGCVPAEHSNVAGPAPPPRHLSLPIGLPVNAAELDQPALARAVELARQAGATELGAGAPWWYVTLGQPPGRYDWRPLDRLVDTALANGMRVRLQLSGTPDSIHPQLVRTVPDHGDRIWYPPRTPAELRAWEVFVADTVRHFAGRVNSYEFWNEPDIHNFWKPTPSPAEYARLLAEGYRSAKRAWPAATVVFGGLSRNNTGYLQHFYDEARRLFPDAGRYRYFFDLLNVHPYTDGRSPDETGPDAVWQGQFGDIDHSFAGLRSMKTVMDDNEGRARTAGKQILIGEYGFTTGRAADQPAVPDRRRAYYLKRAVADAQQLPFVAGLFWYGFLPDSTTPRTGPSSPSTASPPGRTAPCRTSPPGAPQQCGSPTPAPCGPAAARSAPRWPGYMPPT